MLLMSIKLGTLRAEQMTIDNVDPQEQEKFAALAATWWDANGSAKLLHDINPPRLQFVTEQCDLDGKKVLDVGCGGGILSEAMARQQAMVTGIDIGAAILAAARQHANQSQLDIDYQQITVEKLASTASETFDVITCMELLEHVPDPASVVTACAKLCKPKGLMFFSTVNRNMQSYLLAIVAAEYLLHLLPKGTHEYEKFIRPSELAAWARNADLQLIKSSGIQFNPITKQYGLRDNVNINYLMCFQKS